MPKSKRVIKWRSRRQMKRRSTGRRVWQILGALAAVLIVGGIVLLTGSGLAVAAVLSTFTQDLPDFTEIETVGQDNDTFETTKIYALGSDSDGDGERNWELIYEVIDPLGGDRRWLAIGDIPTDLVNATVSIEDKTFWTNEGYDIEGIGRAFYEYVVLGGQVQGGSSITQQVVKNHLIDPERRAVGASVTLDDYQRKLEELMLAGQVSEAYTKEQILEWYLNSNFYGNLAYGIEAAARVYFDKPAALLTLPEAAMLAAIPQSPALNPIDNFDEAKARQELVLEAMLREGYISREQFVAARFSPLTIRTQADDRFDILAPHFAIQVRKELEDRFGSEQVLRGGLTVYSSLDLEMQQQAECVSRAQVGRLSGELGAGIPAEEVADCPALAFIPTPDVDDFGVDRQVNNAAVVMLDPRTGEIKALTGSVNYWDESIDGAFNVAIDGQRQPGSAFKPFTYLTALSQGYSAASMVLDVETDFGTDYNGVAYVPQNYDRRFRGPMSVRQALSNSYNVPAVEVMTWVGVDNVIRTAHKMGITTLDAGPNRYGLSLTLGGGEVSPLDMAYAFGVFANQGNMVGQPLLDADQRLGFRSLGPVSILRVEDRNNQMIYEYSQPEQREILTPELAFLMNDMLSDQRTRCAAFGCPNALELSDGRPVAAKTGTTNDFRDAWTVGYTPQLVTAVWLGNTDNSPMDDVPGSRGAAPVWHALMAWALQDEPYEVWPQPGNVIERPVCAPSGLLPNGVCPTTNELFILGTEPNLVDNMYQAFQVNRENGRLATVDTPPELIETQTYVIYPDRAADWVRENEIAQPPDEYDTLRTTTRNGGIVLESPRPFEYVGDQLVIAGEIPLDDFAYYRIAYFEGLSPGELLVIGDNLQPPEDDQPLAIWDVGNLSGLHTILVTVVRNDGSFAEVTVPITIDREPPEAEIQLPFDGAEFTLEDEFLSIQMAVSDDLSLDRVEFYLDGSGVPFAISSVPPYTESWPIRTVGCHTLRAVAIDAAGNEGESASVAFCVSADE